MLTLLPTLTFPITSRQVNALMDNVQQLNVVDAGVDPRTQKALDIHFHIWELYAKSKGAIDYTGASGHSRLFQDSVTFVPEVLVTKHGDLRAAHLAVDFSNMQSKLHESGFPILTNNTDLLIDQCRDILTMPMRTEERMSLLLTYLAKKSF